MRKRIVLLFLLYEVLCLIFLSISIYAEGNNTGDVNGDGIMDVADAIVLREYLVGDPVAVYEAGADFNGDNAVDLKDLVLMERFLGINTAEISVTPSPTPGPQDESVTVQEVLYGKSELGKDLVCTVIEPIAYDRTVLANFAIHGFEDWYDHDAQVLVDTAELVISHFQEAEDMHRCRLLVISCANPDGLLEGYTKDGFGRCNANGVDLNRDFDAAHYAYTSARNYTPYAFSASESRALRDLVLTYKPDVVLDCHGWENCTIGDSELAKLFYEEEGLAHKATFSDNAHGYFSYWAHQQGALALLVEFTNPDFDKTAFVRAMDRLVAGDYETDEGIYAVDETFSDFTQIQTYAISTGNIPVYLDIGGEEGGTIYGSEDLCTIEKIYKNGWIRVRYPISSGYKEAYCQLDVFMDPIEEEKLQVINFGQNQTVYRRKELSDKLGTVYSSDTVYLVSKTENAWQILYPLDSGGWKMGWVSMGPGTVSAASVEEGTNRVDCKINENNAMNTVSVVDPDIVPPEESEVADLQWIHEAYAASAASTVLSEGIVRFVSDGNIEIPIIVQTNDLTALRMWILTDSKILEYLSVKNGNCLRGLTEAKDKTGSMSAVLWADSLQKDAVSCKGNLGVARFALKPGVSEGETKVTFLVQTGDALTFSLNEVTVSSVDVCVNIQQVETENLSLPESVTEIEQEAFMGGNFSEVVLKSGMKTIGERAFAYCPNLMKIIIPASTTNIAADAFSGVSDDFSIYGEEGSYAEYYAKRNGFKFVREFNY